MVMPKKKKKFLKDKKITIRINSVQKKIMKKNNLKPSQIFKKGYESSLKEISFEGNRINTIDNIFNILFKKQDRGRKK